MAYTIDTRYEKARGCGYRQKGGLYMVSGYGSAPCGKLPIEVTVCPCCGQGIQFSRGYTWVSAQLIQDAQCKAPGCKTSSRGGCFPFGSTIKRYGLMWVGEKYYKTPAYFSQEAHVQGISKRLPFVPKDFTVGVDWILLAHAKTPFAGGPNGTELKPGIFMAFCPDRIEYVIKGTETDDELQAMVDRGLTLVDVKKWAECPDAKADVQATLNLN